MTPGTWVLFFHLAGVVVTGTDTTYASRAECERAGAAWLASVQHRSANDHFECFKRREK